MYLFQVIEANEKLEKELKELRESGDISVSSLTDDTHDELRRLQAENKALQKNLQGKCVFTHAFMCTTYIVVTS